MTVSRGLFFFLLISILPASAPAQGTPYRSFFLPRDSETASLSQDLNRLGGDKIFSLWTSKVEVADFTGLDQVPIHELRQRLAEEDPRWTPFLRHVAGLFEISHGGVGGHLILIPPGLWNSDLAAVLEEAGATEILSTDNTGGVPGPLAGILSMVLYLLWGLLWWRILPKVRLFHGVVFFLGLGVTLVLPPLLVPVMGFQVIILKGQEIIRKFHEIRNSQTSVDLTSSLVKAGILFAGMATLGLTVYSDLAWWTGFLILSLVTAGSGTAYWHFRRQEAQRQEHRYFSPLGLRTSRPQPLRLVKYAGLLILPLLGIGATSAPEVPVSGLYAGEDLVLPGFSEETESARRGQESSGRPGTASWLAHRIYQETFVFRPWSGTLEAPPGPVLLPTFVRRDGRIQQEQTPILRLDSGWLDTLPGQLMANHPVNLAAAGYKAGISLPSLGSSSQWSGILTLGLLYFFLLLVRWFPAFGQEKGPAGVETRRDSLA